MLVLGVRCTKDKLDWVVLRGESRGDAEIVEQEKVTAPAGSRGEQLAWVRKEITELAGRHHLDAAAVRVSEPSGQAFSPGRSEFDGVVQEALHAAGVDPQHHIGANIRGLFRAANKEAREALLASLPAITGTAKSRQEPVISAVALLPA